MKPFLYVLCATEDSRHAWLKRAEHHCDLEVVPRYPLESGIGEVHRIAGEAERPFLVCRDTIWAGLGMGEHVERLIEELDARYPNWAACGNRGVRWDETTVDFSKDAGASALSTSLSPRPVIVLDDNLLLINPRVLRAHRDRAPLAGSLRSGVLLSLECLSNGSAMFASPRLMALRTEDELEENSFLETDETFRAYYRQRFTSHYLPAPGGGLHLSDAVDFSYVAEPAADAPQRDLLDLYDRAMEQARRKPSLTICCRTQFNRPEMLERAVLSFSACRKCEPLLGALHVRLVTDQPEETARPGLERLGRIYPAAEIECWFHPVREARLSRIDLLRGAIERAETDYIWFIDDDDFVNPAAFTCLARCLAPDDPVVVISSSAIVKEEWQTVEAPGTAPRRTLVSAVRSGGYPARNIFGILRGDNQIPICGMIFPVELLRTRLRNVKALGEYGEDYFLLLLALTAPRVEARVLDVDLASVSSRGQENTTAQTDRSVWRQSYATFMLELLNNQEGNSPFLWQEGNASLWDWMGP